MELKKIESIDLRAIGLDEKWLQNQILNDVSILGLGELDILGRERRQPTRGKIDFLLYSYSDEKEVYYEVEVMLGTLDESHIIRTIEYWDIERQRRPTAEHRAVIVAEKITSRFFNVLRLLNRSVPMIAVQLSAFKLEDGSVVIHPVTVLDVAEETPEAYALDQQEKAERPYWEKRRDPASMALLDKIVTALSSSGIEMRVAYRKPNIAAGSTGTQFVWFHPRKAVGVWAIEIKLTDESRDEQLSKLQEAGLDASARSTDRITVVGVSDKTIEKALIPLTAVLKEAERLSR
ncbi:hypothetical protein [Bradyrhizobium aeschynomenes]|uniref:hypothetical protein n=1 Tax=Bradyrhizobium aeschynomenes TaxID=2734909 RepID=UPI001556D550|nr:hypothetical protein [Bradyrhizobium aeschynomenes]NPV24438.1 hypothetical protein [Bradyrhizobium aeschynomenes]